MFNVGLAGDHLYGKPLFTWLSLLISLIVSYFVLSFFPRDVFDEICYDLSRFLRLFLPTLTAGSDADRKISTRGCMNGKYMGYGLKH